MSTWTTIKPEFKEGCLLVTANLIRKEWEYEAWIVKMINNGEGNYMALLQGDGEEWGPLEDLKADKYLILPEA